MIDRVRREFITLVGGALAAWPVARARGQPSAMPVIGLLNGQSPDGYAHLTAALRKGLSEKGYVEGQNFRFEYRWAEGHDDRLSALAADLVRLHVDLILGGGSPSATLAAKATTSTIPIVFTTGLDPIKLGLVPSLNRPGGNVTGVAFLVSQLTAKRVEHLHQLLPGAKTIAGLFNPDNPETPVTRKEFEDAARAMGLHPQALSAATTNEIDSAFARLGGSKPDALFVGNDPFFNNNREKIVALAARHAVPASYELREFVTDGGLMSYGTSITEAYRQAGIYAARILNGEKPADLPVIQSTKFEFVLNLKTAKTLGISVPSNLLALADEVIE